MSYKRLTERDKDGYPHFVGTGELQKSYLAVLNRLAELEDKIEDEALVEFPFVKYQKEDDSWKLWFIDEYGEFDCYTYDDKKEAEIELKELRNE